MNAPFDPVAYFAAPRPSFWQWDDNGQVVAWSDSRAIAFRPEISAVATRLAPRGLPPFGALLLALAACRENWLEDPPRRHLLASYSERIDARPSLGSMEAEVCALLGEVHKAWDVLRYEGDAKGRLLSAIFDRLPGLPKTHEIDELQLMLGDPVVLAAVVGNIVDPRQALAATLGALYTALGGVTAEGLVNRVRTGLDDVILAVEVEPPPPEGTARDLIHALEDDDDLGGIARLAKLVLASLNLPRAVSDPDELPDGGLSDITNRGPLDRLLLSELAHDDLTLSVRVALKEALYLRREAPPRTPPRQRSVLIDCGLRLWGVPRVFAAGVGLAIAAGSEQGFETSVWRTAGDALEPANFHTREGLLAHLEALDHKAHPAVALARLCDRLEEEAESPEIVLVTSEDALADHEFLATLGNIALPTLFIATVNREGRYRLLARHASGSKLLREATFDLDDVLSPKAKSSGQLFEKHGSESLPALCREKPFPLFLSSGVHAERAWYAGRERGVLLLARDGRLLQWTDPSRGARQLAEGLPSGQVQWCETRREQVRAVVGSLKKTGLKLLTYNFASGAAESFPLRLQYEHPKVVAGYGGVVFVISGQQTLGVCEAFDATSGARLGERHFKGKLNWTRGRFVVEPGRARRWLALAWHGTQIDAEWVADDDANLHTAAIGAFHIATMIDFNGPVIITTDGEAHFGNIDEWRFHTPCKHQGKVLSVSRDGRFFLFQVPGAQPLLVDLAERKATVHQGTVTPVLEPLLWQFARPRTLRYRFGGIGIDQQRRLTLITSSGDRWPIMLSSDRHAIILPKTPSKESKCERLPFYSPTDDSAGPYDLRYARWPDGSQAALDARGLLHLRSSDRTIPEFSIVLAEGETAGWAADGTRWGPTYFTGDVSRTAAHRVYREFITPFVERLR